MDFYFIPELGVELSTWKGVFASLHIADASWTAFGFLGFI
jgi:hypothetical protein